MPKRLGVVPERCSGCRLCESVCALLYFPQHELGEANRVGSVLRCAHMKEVEYVEKGERKKLRCAQIGGE